MADRLSPPQFSPSPGALAPASTRRWSLWLPEEMDPARGRCRLAWGRIAAHHINQGGRFFEWQVGRGPLRWRDREGGSELCLELPGPLGAGFRLRVEWSELWTRAGRRLEDQSAVVALALPAEQRRPEAPAPSLALRPPPGELLSTDPRLELLPAQPMQEPLIIALSQGGRPLEFELHSNRNPPDWWWLHPRQPLQPGLDLELRLHLLDTAGRALELEARWPVSPAPSAGPTISPRLSEPPPGAEGCPAEAMQLCLRQEQARALLPRLGDLQLCEEGGPPLSGLRLRCDPTPGHYGAVLITAPGLRPGRAHVLGWSGLGPGGIGAPGELRFRTAAEGEAPIPLCPLATAMSIFATPEGSWVQPVVQALGPTGLRAGRLRLEGDPSWVLELGSPRLQAFSSQLGGPPPQLLRAEPGQGLLPPGSGLRRFGLEVEDQHQRIRSFAAQAWDHGPAALTGLGRRGAQVLWELHQAVDSVHIAILDEERVPLCAGLAPGLPGPGRWELPWRLPRPPALIQAWLLRARPEDDLWDYFVAELRWG